MSKRQTCRDCKWSTGDAAFLRCGAPKNLITDPVCGGEKPRWIYCSTMRTENRFWAWSIKSCGLAGRWWGPRRYETAQPTADGLTHVADTDTQPRSGKSPQESIPA